MSDAALIAPIRHRAHKPPDGCGKAGCGGVKITSDALYEGCLSSASRRREAYLIAKRATLSGPSLFGPGIFQLSKESAEMAIKNQSDIKIREIIGRARYELRVNCSTVFGGLYWYPDAVGLV
jgi:hypothetical protein